MLALVGGVTGINNLNGFSLLFSHNSYNIDKVCFLQLLPVLAGSSKCRYRSVFPRAKGILSNLDLTIITGHIIRKHLFYLKGTYIF